MVEVRTKNPPDYNAVFLVWWACYYAHPGMVKATALASILGDHEKLQRTLTAMQELVYEDDGEIGFSVAESRRVSCLEAMHQDYDASPSWGFRRKPAKPTGKTVTRVISGVGISERIL